MKKTFRIWNWDMGTYHGFATCTPTDKRTKTNKRIWVDTKSGTKYVLERFSDGLAFHRWAEDFT